RVTLEGLDSWLSKCAEFQVVGRTDNADAAIDLAASLTPRVILLDLHLPGKRGIEETLKELLTTSSKIVVFSAEDRSHLIKLVMKLGASAYLSKSESFETISQVINEVVAGKTGFISESLRKKENRNWLTPAEEEILSMLARGMKYEEMASVRVTSP